MMEKERNKPKPQPEPKKECCVCLEIKEHHRCDYSWECKTCKAFICNECSAGYVGELPLEPVSITCLADCYCSEVKMPCPLCRSPHIVDF
jgi:hypothetical protein